MSRERQSHAATRRCGYLCGLSSPREAAAGNIINALVTEAILGICTGFHRPPRPRHHVQLTRSCSDDKGERENVTEYKCSFSEN